MTRYRVAVCRGADCRHRGADGVYRAAQAEVSRLGLAANCTLYRAGCYGLCEFGPNVVIRPDLGKKDPFSREDFQLVGTPGETHYGAMNAEKVSRVLAEHVGNDQPVEEWRGGEKQKSTDP
jgi:(2Fe-2S) ferredoxin